MRSEEEVGYEYMGSKMNGLVVIQISDVGLDPNQEYNWGNTSKLGETQASLLRSW